jgi:hypothetical protein
MLGKTRWILAEGYIPEVGPHHDDSTLRSHETACVLNAGDQPAALSIMVYFADREPAGPYQLEVPARRTLHLRFDELDDPEPVPRETDYSTVIESSQPVVVQHTRLDARLGSLALLSTLAYGEDR